MQAEVISIRRCVGCNGRAEAGDACYNCVENPLRGLKYVAACRRIRNDPRYKLECWNQLPDSHKIAFADLFGNPEQHTEAKVIPFKIRG